MSRIGQFAGRCDYLISVALNAANSEYQLTVPTDPDRDLDEILATLLDDMHRMADTHQCFLEASFSTDDGRHWD